MVDLIEDEWGDETTNCKKNIERVKQCFAVSIKTFEARIFGLAAGHAFSLVGV